MHRVLHEEEESLSGLESRDDMSWVAGREVVTTPSFQLKMEIKHLRSQLEALAGGTDAVELADVLREREEELASLRSENDELARNLVQVQTKSVPARAANASQCSASSSDLSELLSAVEAERDTAQAYARKERRERQRLERQLCAEAFGRARDARVGAAAAERELELRERLMSFPQERFVDGLEAALAAAEAARDLARTEAQELLDARNEARANERALLLRLEQIEQTEEERRESGCDPMALEEALLDTVTDTTHRPQPTPIQLCFADADIKDAASERDEALELADQALAERDAAFEARDDLESRCAELQSKLAQTQAELCSLRGDVNDVDEKVKSSQEELQIASMARDTEPTVITGSDAGDFDTVGFDLLSVKAHESTRQEPGNDVDFRKGERSEHLIALPDRENAHIHEETIDALRLELQSLTGKLERTRRERLAESEHVADLEAELEALRASSEETIHELRCELQSGTELLEIMRRDDSVKALQLADRDTELDVLSKSYENTIEALRAELRIATSSVEDYRGKEAAQMKEWQAREAELKALTVSKNTEAEAMRSELKSVNAVLEATQRDLAREIEERRESDSQMKAIRSDCEKKMIALRGELHDATGVIEKTRRANMEQENRCLELETLCCAHEETNGELRDELERVRGAFETTRQEQHDAIEALRHERDEMERAYEMALRECSNLDAAARDRDEAGEEMRAELQQTRSRVDEAIRERDAASSRAQAAEEAERKRFAHLLDEVQQRHKGETSALRRRIDESLVRIETVSREKEAAAARAAELSEELEHQRASDVPAARYEDAARRAAEIGMCKMAEREAEEIRKELALVVNALADAQSLARRAQEERERADEAHALRLGEEQAEYERRHKIFQRDVEFAEAHARTLGDDLARVEAELEASNAAAAAAIAQEPLASKRDVLERERLIEAAKEAKRREAEYRRDADRADLRAQMLRHEIQRLRDELQSARTELRCLQPQTPLPISLVENGEEDDAVVQRAARARAEAARVLRAADSALHKHDAAVRNRSREPQSAFSAAHATPAASFLKYKTELNTPTRASVNGARVLRELTSNLQYATLDAQARAKSSSAFRKYTSSRKTGENVAYRDKADAIGSASTHSVSSCLV